jgi:hypothetical protein
MSRRRSNGWRQAAKSAAYDYPALRRELDALQAGGGVTMDGMPGSREARRSTEDAALRELDWQQQRRLDAVEHAIRISSQLTSGPSRVKLIELVYLLPKDRQYKLEGAAMQIPVSVQMAKIWNNDFLLLVWGQLRGK